MTKSIYHDLGHSICSFNLGASSSSSLGFPFYFSNSAFFIYSFYTKSISASFSIPAYFIWLGIQNLNVLLQLVQNLLNKRRKIALPFFA